MRKKFCVAANSNANGDPDLFFCVVECSESEHENGDSYESAKEQAVDADYEAPFVVFSEDDAAGKALLEHYEFE